MADNSKDGREETGEKLTKVTKYGKIQHILQFLSQNRQIDKKGYRINSQWRIYKVTPTIKISWFFNELYYHINEQVLFGTGLALKNT